MRFFSVPATQPEPQPTQPEGDGMLTSSFEIIKLHRIKYINIYEIIIELAALMVGTYIFTCRHRNDPFCVEFSR